MDDFTFYANKNGAIWYRCNHCQYLTRGKPQVCPVCNGHGDLIEKTKNNAYSNDKALDNLLQQYKNIMDKYGGDV